MWDVIRSLIADGSTVLLTTQQLEEADALADAITVIDEGRVIAHDTADGLKRVVGGQRLQVRPADPDRFAETAAILAATVGRARELVGHGTHRVLRVTVDDDAVLGATVPRLAEAGISLTELSLHLPSLDEVFFTLTGRHNTDIDTDTDKEAEVT